MTWKDRISWPRLICGIYLLLASRLEDYFWVGGGEGQARTQTLLVGLKMFAGSCYSVNEELV